LEYLVHHVAKSIYKFHRRIIRKGLALLEGLGDTVGKGC